ncbi:hypothetical protein CTI12_AA247570 [Artemisia annua]|uniref:DUF4283 domain-containing protein n=1 Tax=Artemisia annua TaxID=35608 RepID=A0A2U1NN84_ARTAN|nr:hypothetical protein CTI12_AA247570 [Artemisia annua]
MWLNDHVVSSLSSKRTGNVSATTVNEIRVNGSGEIDELEDKSKGKSNTGKDSTIVNEVNDSDLLKASTRTGSVKWQNTICGYFVGQNMMVGELRYHIRRMWSRFGLREIIANNSGVNLFKFKDEESMQYVLDQGPWMVNSRPMFVMKWDHGMGMQKVEPTKLPVWVKLLAIPMEAWSMEGISALSSCLGKPIMMDDMTAKMCQFGNGKTDFARILVELDAKKVIKDSIRIEYTNKDASIKGTKEVKVVYDWRPEICTYCNVFGHCDGKCNKRPMSEEEIKASKEAEKVTKRENEVKKQQWQQQTKKYGYGNNYYKQEYRKKKVPNNVDKNADNRNQNIAKESTDEQGTKGVKGKEKVDVNNNVREDSNTKQGKHGNRYNALINIEDEDGSGSETQKNGSNEQVGTSGNQEDVYESGNGIAQTMAANVVNGMSKNVLV